MSAIAEKLRKAREVKVEAGGFTFLVRRPTDLEAIGLRKAEAGRAVMPFIIGWENVSEIAILGKGSPHPVEFDPDLCNEWLQDRLDILSALIDAVFKAYQDHLDKVAEAVKN